MSDREPFGGLTEAEIENLVERGTEKVVENFYADAQGVTDSDWRRFGCGVAFRLAGKL